MQRSNLDGQGTARIPIRRKVTLDQLDHLPSDLHRLVAQALIKKGEWVLLNDDDAERIR